MKKYLLFTYGLACAFFSATMAGAQSTVPAKMYIKYDEYYHDLGKQLLAAKQDHPVRKTLKETEADAALLKDDLAPAENIKMIAGNKKILSGENIFDKRKNSVFIVGKLMCSNSGNPSSMNFDLIGTAFAISADGICVTNYHVLKNILQSEETEGGRDSLYFIITNEKKIYWLERILAFSKNNDLAIFKVSVQGEKLVPLPIGEPANVGAQVYCLSHPLAHFYYFTQGIVARNVTIDTLDLGSQYDKKGNPPIRMEITADYAIGSSGGPILDGSGNLIGIVISTVPISWSGKDGGGKDIGFIQMMVKATSPVKALTQLLRK